MVVKVWPTDPWGLLRLFQEVYKIQAMLIVILRHYLPFSLYGRLHKWGTNGTNAMVDKTAGALAQPCGIKSVTAIIVCFTATHLF